MGECNRFTMQVVTSTWQRILLQSAGGFASNDSLLSELPHHLRRRSEARRLISRLRPPYIYMDLNERFRHYFKVWSL